MKQLLLILSRFIKFTLENNNFLIFMKRDIVTPILSRR